MLGMAVYMGGGPSLMYAADAISAYEQFQNATERCGLTGCACPNSFDPAARSAA